MKQHDGNTTLMDFNRFLLQFRQDLKQWLFFMLLLSLFRVAFLFTFWSRVGSATGFSDVLLSALNGLRYDSMVSTYWILLPFLTSILSGFLPIDRFANRVRAVFGNLFLIITVIVWIITFGFFKEYNAQFNHFIFNLYYDDAKAIFQTIWADYHPVPVFILIVIVSLLSIIIRTRLVQNDAIAVKRFSARSLGFPHRLLLVLLILSLLLIAARGSIGHRPAQRKDVGISRDAFLNQAVLNPYFALLFAIQDHKQQTGRAGLEWYLIDRNVRAAAQELFSNHRSFDNLDAYLEKSAKGSQSVPPRHIFLIVMESYDAWPFIGKYASLGLTENLSRLAEHGISFKKFLPASDGTMQSLTAIMTSIPYSHVEINYQTTARKPYPSSLFATFKRLGYRTRLFYGGSLSWQRFGEFAKDQGAGEVYGAPHMGREAATHEWGVEDEYLFDFIVNTVDDRQPSFNIIMTTSYHPPYNVDVWGKGFPLEKVPTDIAPLFDNTTSLKMLGHLWYSDKCLGDFVRKVEGKLQRPLFAFTGDHYGRKFINAKPDYFEQSGVPLILYGKETLRGIKAPPGAAGSHIDIGPTLIELTAPKGFIYYSVGQDLLAPREQFYAVGWSRIISNDFILDLERQEFHPLPGQALPSDLPDFYELDRIYRRTYGIGWWRVRKGENL